MKLLDSIGNLFVYKSPPPMSGRRLRKFQLMGMSNRVLKKLVPTPSNYAKKDLVKMILEKESR